MTLGVGLGGEGSSDPERFGESADTKVLAEELDESLKIVTGLWSGKKFSFKGKTLSRRRLDIPAFPSAKATNSYLGRRDVAK